ncbi:phosphoglycerate kinase [bacterium]|nr:phosphoglycerate kinase [bacterium]|tara:strand:+ start:214 stop:1434 length:1221 start_codon:yes stop_codon:yes gene_type:complete
MSAVVLTQTTPVLSNWAGTLAGQRVLVRVDFNVPFRSNGTIADQARIIESLPTLNFLIQEQARIVLISHLGRPDGPSKRHRLLPVAEALATHLGQAVQYCPSPIDSAETLAMVNAMSNGHVLLLENIRFDPRESVNDPVFSKVLANLGERFVFDAFGVAHRSHASTAGITAHLPSCVGFLVETELRYLNTILSQPDSPKLAIIGGAKISTKLGVLQNLLGRVDQLVIGGAMMFTLLKAQGFSIGDSLCEPNLIDTAAAFLAAAATSSTELYIAEDARCAPGFKAKTADVYPTTALPDGHMGLDIGPASIAYIERWVQNAKTIIWNGPLGAFESPLFSSGTRSIGQAVARNTGISVVGGGDSVQAIHDFDIDPSGISHISTGGGACLAVLEGQPLPSISAIQSCPKA